MMYANASVEITMEEKHNDLTEIIVHALKDWMNIFFQLRSKFGWILFSVARVLRSFSPLSSSITRSDLNLALKFLLCLDIIMNPLFHTEFSISDSLKMSEKVS